MTTTKPADTTNDARALLRTAQALQSANRASLLRREQETRLLAQIERSVTG
jgi:hypothetical protein